MNLYHYLSLLRDKDIPNWLREAIDWVRHELYYRDLINNKIVTKVINKTKHKILVGDLVSLKNGTNEVKIVYGNGKCK